MRKILLALLGCSLALGAQPTDLSVTYQVSSLPFNTKADEFAPAVSGDGLLFSKRYQPATTAWQTVEEASRSDIFYVAKKANAFQKEATIVKGKLNSRLPELTPTVSANGKRMYFSRVYKNRSTVRWMIYTAEMAYGSWNYIAPAWADFTTGNFMHPCLSADGNSLFFVATGKKEGSGGTDIYVSKRIGNMWGKPTNLGPLVNTPSDELYPTVQADGTLIFASNRPRGNGGFDLYTTHSDNQIDWYTPQRLPEPLNSAYNDLSLLWNTDATSGYLVSNRPGSAGGLDVFGVKTVAAPPAKLNAPPAIDYQLTANFDYSLIDPQTRTINEALRLEPIHFAPNDLKLSPQAFGRIEQGDYVYVYQPQFYHRGDGAHRYPR